MALTVNSYCEETAVSTQTLSQSGANVEKGYVLGCHFLGRKDRPVCLQEQPRCIGAHLNGKTAFRSFHRSETLRGGHVLIRRHPDKLV